MSFRTHSANAKALLFAGLGDVLAPILRPEIVSHSNSTDGNPIANFHPLASYSWLESSHPSIVVPGELQAPQMNYE